jgi:hypothetical protein
MTFKSLKSTNFHPADDYLPIGKKILNEIEKPPIIQDNRVYPGALGLFYESAAG